MAQLGWRNVDNAKGVSFTDITQNKAAETYTNDQIRILDVSADKEHIGDTVLEAFRGSNTGHLFYGEPTQTRADVTKDGKKEIESLFILPFLKGTSIQFTYPYQIYTINNNKTSILKSILTNCHNR